VDERTVRRRDREPFRARFDVLDGAMTDVDVRKLLELPPAAASQFGRLHPVMSEQPADVAFAGEANPIGRFQITTRTDEAELRGVGLARPRPR
jgi:hypothetical protein